MTVNLTTMLVMTTIFISKMEGLPPTSATKMIDIWLILCQLVPFAEVVLLTAMEYQREDKFQKEEINDNKEASKDQGDEQHDPERPVLEVCESWEAPQKKFSLNLKMIGITTSATSLADFSF